MAHVRSACPPPPQGPKATRPTGCVVRGTESVERDHGCRGLGRGACAAGPCTAAASGSAAPLHPIGPRRQKWLIPSYPPPCLYTYKHKKKKKKKIKIIK